MADLISRSALMAHFKQEEWGTPDERWRPEREFGRMVLNAPAVDAVEVVRCGECKWYFENENYETLDTIPFCDHPEGGGVTRGKQWHCADGERKDEVKE